MSQDFSKGKIYKITNDFNDDVYVGSTCDTLVKRYSYHKFSLNDTKVNKRPLYNLMNEIGFERFRIELIENFSGNDKYQMRQREGYWIRQIGTLNMIIAGRTTKEYNDDHKDYRREYYETNKTTITQKNKEYVEKNKDVIKQYKKKYTEDNKNKIQDYKKTNYEINKDTILEKQKNYYQQNKAKIHEKNKEKITCECGCEVNKCGLIKHQKTQKHQNYSLKTNSLSNAL